MPHSNRSLKLSLLLGLSVALAGCSVTQQELAHTTSNSASFAGKVFGGQQPISGATVTLWGVGYADYGGSDATLLAATQTDASGRFDFANAPAYTCVPGNNRPLYILASGGNPGLATGVVNHQIVLGAGIGRCGDAQSVVVNVNEVTTAVLAYTMGHFFNPTLGGDYTTDTFGGPPISPYAYNFGIIVADDDTIPSLVDLPTGKVQPNTATTTIESAKIYSLANALAACVNSAGTVAAGSTSLRPNTNSKVATDSCSLLFSYTTPPNSSTAPADTLQAAVQVALYPWQHVADIYYLGNSGISPFVGLSQAPHDWTLGVSYSSSSDFALSINASSSSNIDIDSSGTIYFPTDSPSKAGAGTFDVTSLAFSGPIYPDGGQGSLLIHPQYIAIGGGTDHDIVITDLGSSEVYDLRNRFFSTNGFTGPITGYADPKTGNDLFYFTAGGSIFGLGRGLYSSTYANGVAPEIGEFNGPPSGMTSYRDGTYPGVDASTTGSYPGSCYLEEHYGAPDYIDATTAGVPCTAGGVAAATRGYDSLSVTSTNQVCSIDSHACFDPPLALNNPQGVALDGDGNFWVVNSGNASVSTFGYAPANLDASDYFATSTVQYLHDANNGNTMTLPYGIAIDNAGNVWVSNAGCISVESPDSYCTPGPFVLSVLIGAAAPTTTPLSSQNVNGTQGMRPGATSNTAGATPHHQVRASDRQYPKLRR